MYTKFIILFSLFSICTSYRKYFSNYNLKAEIAQYKTPDCTFDDEEYRLLNNRDKQTTDVRRRTSDFDLGSYYDRYDGGYQSRFDDRSEESEFHPNPYMYVGYGAVHGDVMDSYIPQDLRNQRRNAGKFQSRNKFNMHSNMNNAPNNENCISQCIFNNMDVLEESGVPSEGAMLKWAQTKIRSERKKFIVLKEINRCFATVPNSSKDDGCEYSRYISACLKLGLDEEF